MSGKISESSFPVACVDVIPVAFSNEVLTRMYFPSRSLSATVLGMLLTESRSCS